MTSEPVKMAEIAALAGVSIPTVSKVLNNRPGVSDATRARVEQIVTDAGYERRSKNTLDTGLIDIVVPGLDTQWAADLMRGAQLEAATAGIDLVVSTTGGGEFAPAAWVQRVAHRGTDGVVLVVSDLTEDARAEIARLNAPVVLIDPVGSDSHGFATVSATDWAGGRDATAHLLALGHRRIGFITGRLDLASHQDRLDGYRAALRRVGIAEDPRLVREGNSLVQGGIDHGRALLDLLEPPTAIVSGSDEQAYGIYLAARERGLTIPDDLSVVGFDDVDLCQWVQPTLTTVRQPLVDMAREATRMVIESARGRTLAHPRVELATSIVVRESTAPPRQRA